MRSTNWFTSPYEDKTLGRYVLLLAATALALSVVAPAQQRPYITWQEYEGGPAGADYSALAQINHSNVSRLTVAWKYATGDNIAYQFNPLIAGNTMVVMAKNYSMVALDASTGRELWTYRDPKAPPRTAARGISYWESKDGQKQRLLFPVGYYLEEIDARTGELVSSFGQQGKVDMRVGLGRDPNSIRRIASGSPGVVFGNLIIEGSSTGEDYGSPPGDVRAYDVETGDLIWTFHMVPHPGETGYNTWPPNAWKYSGGADSWGGMAVDTKRGIVYIPTAAPKNEFYGGDRRGDNLFSDCLVALNARTGKLIWYFQFVHHDIWDFDGSATPQLVTVTHGGKRVDVVAEAGKTGFLYVFSRDTGKPLWPIEERKTPPSHVPGEVTAATQPFPTAPPPFARQSFTADDVDPYVLSATDQAAWRKRIEKAVNFGMFTPPEETETVEMPGNRGGANVGMSAADPANGMVYVISADLPGILKMERQRPPSLFAIPHNLPPAQTGRAVYQEFCQRCHGPDRQGAPPAIPSLVDAAAQIGPAGISSIVDNGMGNMPAFSDLTGGLLENLIQFLRHPEEAPEPVKLQSSAYAAKASPYPAGVEAPITAFYYTPYGLVPEAIKPPWSTITAYDLNRGTIQWQIPFGKAPQAPNAPGSSIMEPRNGMAVTGGGLIFAATIDEGKLRAYDSSTGQVLWSTDLPAASEGTPAVYEEQGREFVVLPVCTVKGTNLPRDRSAIPQPETQPLERGYIAFALPDTAAAQNQ